MTEDVSLLSAIIIVLFLLFGAGLTLLGMVGLLRFKSFYDRLHMVSLATSWGVGGVILASLLFSLLVEKNIVLHELVISVFMIVTTPITLMLLSRAAMNQDYSEDWRNIPSSLLVRRPKDENTMLEDKEQTRVSKNVVQQKITDVDKDSAHI